MELTFVHQYAGDTPKRRRLAKACESCRARKASVVTAPTPHLPPDYPLTFASQKRCVHFAHGDHEGETDGSDGAAAAHNTERSSAETPNSTGGGKRFVSDLNPEAAFLNRPSSHDGEAQRPPNDDIGIWVDRQEFEALLKHKNQSTSGGGTSRHAYASSTQLERPHSAVLGPLIDIYFRRIHIFLPLLDEDEFRQQHAAGLVPEPLAHAVCLVAAKDAQAEPHLKLGQSSTALPPRDFCSRLHSSVMGALRAPCKYDKVTLIRILALVSMHNVSFDRRLEVLSNC